MRRQQWGETVGTFHRLTYHIVFGTRYRRKIILPAYQERLYEYMGGTIRGLKGHLVEIGGVEDHVHLLVNLPPVLSLSDAVRDIKANSSKWVDENDLTADVFEWQKGYGAFTVSYSNVEVVRKYIRNQKMHHRVRSFREEYIEFLRRHGIEFEERYLFEGEHTG